MKSHWAYLVLVLEFLACRLPAQDSPPGTNDIKALLQRIEELEQKVKALEQNQKPAPDTNAAAREQKIQELDQKLKVVQRNMELDEESAAAKAKELPRITLGADGFAFRSADTNFAVQLGGVLQVDSRSFFEDHGISGNDGMLLRRARPVLSGTVFRDFDFLFVPDFGTANNGNAGSSTPTIFDAYLNYRFRPELQLRGGKFKSPVGLEQLVADRDLLFNERALPTDLVPNRDIGFALWGDLFGGVASYSVGIYNGVGDARNSSNSDFEDNKAFEGRVFFQPFKKSGLAAVEQFGFGLGGSYESMQGTNTSGLPNTTGGSLPGYATVGQQQFFAYNPANKSVVVADGEHWRLSPQGYWYYGPLGLLGEYVISNQRVTRTGTNAQPVVDLNDTAWQVAGSWILTGEDATFTTVVPRHPFHLTSGDWGAWQLVARYSELDVDSDAFPLFSDPKTSARKAHEWSVGLNWYLNRNVAFKTSFAHTWFEGGGGSATSAPGNVSRQAENVLFTRFQLAF
jgi:phosphate-selective porin OprO/OprP